MLAIRDVAVRYGNDDAGWLFSDCNLSLEAGQFIAIMGESGAGKSTLLNLIAGLDRPHRGTIHFSGHDLFREDDEALARLRRREMGFIFQAFHLLPHLTIAQNAGLPLALNNAPPALIAQRVGEMLQRVGLGDRANGYPHELSGGEMQRVAIARALVHRPRLLLADEPTGSLDADNAARVLELLKQQIEQEKMATVLVTHSATAASIADRIYFLTPHGLVPGDKNP